MKKLKLLLAFCALLLGWSNAMAEEIAWTDKTSLITNPSFETGDAIADLTTCGWATDRVTGWTISPSSPGNAQVGVGNSSSTIQGIASSFSPSAGDKYFYMRENWNPNTTFSISQTIADGNIPAGIYRLTVKAAMFSSVASTYTLSLQEEGQTAATNSFSYAGTTNSESWKDWSVMLIKQADGTDLTITAAYKTPSENSGGKHYCLLLDDVKLEYIAPTSVSSTNTLDITGLMANPSFELNTYTGTKDAASSIEQNAGGHKYATGWTYLIKETGWSNVQSITAAPADGSYAVETWAGNPIEFKVYQNINNLIEGVYEISASARTEKTDANDIRTYAKVGSDDPMYSTPFDVSNIKSPWNGADNWQTLTARFSIIGGGDAEVGIHSTKFMQFDNFHLTYLGSDLLLSELKNSFSTKQTTATGLLSNSAYDNVVGTERTTLNTKKSVTPEETVAGWTTAVNELQAAIDAFTAAKTNYDALVTEIAKAKALGIATATADGYAATSSSTAATALTNTQNLKVAEYTYVTTTYPYAVALGEWTSTGTNTSAADFSNEHWSGETHSYKNQNDNNGQGWNANSWSINFNQNVLLPAGTYVFKVAGRQASGDQVTTSLVVKKGEEELGSVNDFPRSNNSRGINKSGETAFEGNNEDFAHNGAGYGWEWRYVKFTLAEEATVNIAVNSVATALHQWVSFGDYTLQADNDDVVDILAYNVAKANAITIRDDARYASVTGSERTALINAINADPTSDYPIATTALNDASNAVVAAAPSYDAYLLAKGYGEAINSTLLPYASTAKLTAVTEALETSVTSAATAVTATTAINTANRAAYESNMNAEGVAGATDRTSLIKNADGNNTAGWSGSFGTMSNEPYTDASGSSTNTYFDKNSIKSFTSSQTIKLVAGTYILSVTARAQAGIDSYKLKVTNNADETEEVALTAMGSANGVFNRGWNVATVEFTQKAFGDATISIVADNTTSDANFWMSWDRFRLVSIDEEGGCPVEVTSAGWATFCSPYALDFSGIEGLTAYIVTGTESGSTLALTPVTSVAANTGVLLEGNAKEYSIPVAASGTDYSATNKLVGVIASDVLTAKAGYVLMGSPKVGFYLNNNDFTLTANTAYLPANFADGGESTARSAYFFRGDITAIEAVEAAAEATLKDGKYLENGKIVIVKNGQKFNAAGQQVK